MSANPRWTARQHALLEALGVRAWWPAKAGEPAAMPDALVPSPAVTTAAPAPAGVPRRAAPEAATPAAPPPVLAPVPALPPAPAVERASAPIVPLALDAPALVQAIRDCRACALCEGRQQTVPGVGAMPAGWMVVGEAPGEQEDRQGEPFVGPAGQLLDAMLAAMNLHRAAPEPARQVFIANTVKCRPPRNRNPEPAEMAACQPFLLRQIELVNPKLVLLFGRMAAQSLLGTDEALGKLRGRVHRLADGRPAIVTYHPSYLLRQPQDKLKAWEDLCLAMDTFDALP